MSLESSIELLAQAINNLVAAQTMSSSVSLPDKDIKTAGQALKQAEGALQEAAAKKSKAEAPTTPESSKASAPTTGSSLPEPGYEDVKKLILAISAKSRDKVVALLARYGAKKGPDLKEEQYALFVHEGNLVLSGDLDPEAGA